MYARLRECQADAPVDYGALRAFAVDKLCPPAPPDGYFWRQITSEFLAWARVPPENCHPFSVDAPDLAAMCRAYEATIAAAGGLDLVMLGLGPNAHLASNEAGSPLDSPTRPVALRPETVRYILSDDVIQGAVSDRAVTLGIGTILKAREVVVLASGRSTGRSRPRCRRRPCAPTRAARSSPTATPRPDAPGTPGHRSRVSRRGGVVPAGGRSYFEIAAPAPAARWRVSVLAYEWLPRGSG
jgi:hypothetical protein